MTNHNVIGIDLAKTSFQACIVNGENKALVNKSLGRRALERWLVQQKPCLVALEACGSAHYWARKAQGYGHEAVLLPPHFVKSFVLGHKTDRNDALGIAVAARQPTAKPVEIQGALAKANVVANKPPRTAKDAWLKALIERRGKRRAAVALANKTIRTAWAMLHYANAYRPSPIMHG